MKTKKLTLVVKEHDLVCLKYAISKLKTPDASEAMTFGSAAMLVDEIVKAWEATPSKKAKGARISG